jgi:Phosphotransferase enzyme family
LKPRREQSGYLLKNRCSNTKRFDLREHDACPNGTPATVSSQEIAAVWRAAQPLVRGRDYVHASRGDCNTVLLVNGDERSVIKSPLPLGDIDTRALLTYEAGVVDLLNQKLTGITDTLPVAVPLLIHHSCGRPSWTAFSWVPGEVLSLEEVQQRFSPDDFRALGEAVGEFAVWLARALDLSSFRRDIERPYGICAVDHELWLAAAVNGKVDRLHKQGYTNLATVLGQLGREYQDLRRTGQLRPTIIGHNDLHIGNLTFVERRDGAMRLAGFIDFAFAKPSTPAREFHFLEQLHPEALRAAMTTWQELTGERVSIDLVRFWERVQCVTTCITRIEWGFPVGRGAVHMQRCYPQYNWRKELAEPMNPSQNSC